MIDFRKHTRRTDQAAETDPQRIYEKLDRASDKGPLRPVQSKVLDKWSNHFHNQKDVILKLHTGEGKTVVGLLILQSAVNRGDGPALYLCPNNHLVAQTCKQAKQFGFRHSTVENELPEDFLDGNVILITSVQKLFNGLTKFGLGTRAHDVNHIVVDDAHACISAIRGAFSISVEQKSQAYQETLSLFEPDLERQGSGTLADIKSGKFDAFLPVPYWAWEEKSSEITRIISRHSEKREIKFAWPLLRDNIKNCLCVVSGTHIEISPYLPPLDQFQSFSRAKHRVFMSATIYDDSYFIKGLGVDPDAVRKPLLDETATWSGEKMVLIPSLISENLTRERIVKHFAQKNKQRKSGVVAITSSFERSKVWSSWGAIVCDKSNINTQIEKLRNGSFEDTVVAVNRYDGIDLPDDTCRILILDGKPFSEDLIDRYTEEMRRDSSIIMKNLSQTIEQGLGRHIRGERDYGVIVLTGANLVRAIRSKRSRKFFSSQTRTQIEIGLQIAEMAKEEIQGDADPHEYIDQPINQCLERDMGWKDFYADEMNSMDSERSMTESQVLTMVERERHAEQLFAKGDVDRALRDLEYIRDNIVDSEEDRAWYYQEMARMTYRVSKTDADRLQKKAFKINPYLLSPESGVEVRKLSPAGEKRVAQILKWCRAFESNEDLRLAVREFRENLRFGVSPERFEGEMKKLGEALGFASERPDKEWKQGPDNLWCLREGEYALIECKNDVNENTKEISRDDAGQMNNAIGWFERHYMNSTVHRWIIHPAKQTAVGGPMNRPVQVIDNGGLGKLRKNVDRFFSEISTKDLRDLTEEYVSEALQNNSLTVEALTKNYTKQVRSS
jgi:replicative superfamily II helicase